MNDYPPIICQDKQGREVIICGACTTERLHSRDEVCWRCGGVRPRPSRATSTAEEYGGDSAAQRNPGLCGDGGEL